MKCSCCGRPEYEGKRFACALFQCPDCGAVLCPECMTAHRMGKDEKTEHRCLLCPMPPKETNGN